MLMSFKPRKKIVDNINNWNFFVKPRPEGPEVYSRKTNDSLWSLIDPHGLEKYEISRMFFFFNLWYEVYDMML